MAAKGNISGSGEKSDPYLIEDVADWNAFAAKVNAEGNMTSSSYQGKFIKLCANIGTEDAPVTNKIGKWFMSISDPSLSLNKPFSGTFDGGGHTITVSIGDEEGVGTALFSYIKGATIKNLTVKGAVSGKNHVAGLVGISEGTENRIENCVVSTTVKGGTHIGGILGHGSSSDIAIDNCVFNGILNDGSIAKGVFFGWGDNGGTKTVSNCLYIQQDGQSTDNLDLVKMNAGSVAVTDCYKTADVGSYGTLAYLNPPTDAITEEKTVAGDTKFYVVTKKLSLTGNGSESAPYIVNDVDQWNEFAEFVHDGASFAGKFIKLVANIDISTKVGVVKNDGTLVAPFSGTFDGGGYTITALIEDVDNSGTALFSYIEGATIKNLTLAGNVTGGIHAAGIVGYSNGTGNKIENCVVSATINGGSHIGGILGHGLTSDIFIDNCVFKGKLVGVEAAKGVFFGWGDDGGTKTVSNCLYIQQDDQKTDHLDLVKGDARTVYVKNCYKTADVGLYGTLVYLIAPTDANMITEEKTAADGTMFYVVAGSSETLVVFAITQMTTGTYRVFDDVTIGERIVITGDVTLILDEGKTLTASKGIDVSEGNSLTIDGKGTLYATGDNVDAGIGGGEYKSGGTITISGGTVTAKAGNYGAGIGGGKGGSGGTITISGGTVTAKAGGYGAGIGGGSQSESGGTITISGGTVDATGGYYGAGIGGGKSGSGGTITISDGTVDAKCYAYGAGIGGGSFGSSGSITINGGIVKAFCGSDAAGIGSGKDGKGNGSITLGWTNEDDFIYASSYDNVSSISFAEDKQFYYEYRGKNVIVENTNDIADKILHPFDGEKNSLKNAVVSGIKPYYLYTGNEISLTYKVTDFEGNQLIEGTDFTVSLAPSQIKNLGDYTLTIMATKNGAYTGTKNINFSVVKFDLENAVVSGIKPYYFYTGNEIDLAFKITDFEGKELVEGIDFTVSLNGSPVKDAFSVKNKGDYTLTIMAKESSLNTKTISFTVGDGIPVTATTTTLRSGFYKVSGRVDFDSRITINGDVTLFLAGSLIANKGIEVSDGNKLTIEGWGDIRAVGDASAAGIGGGEYKSGGTITISGGTVNAKGGMPDVFNGGIGGIPSGGGAGIGGGRGGSGETIPINGGIPGGGAGIGGGRGGSGGTIVINGGKVTAIGGGFDASGIGAGTGASGGSVTLGWTNEGDYIYASSFNVETIRFANDRKFYYTDDESNIVKATTNNINGVTIYPLYDMEKNSIIRGIEQSYAYTGDEICPAYMVLGFNDKNLSPDNYTVTLLKNGVETQAVNTGEYTMVFTGKGNYEGTKKVKFSIVPEVVHNYAAVQVLKDENGTRAAIDGEYDGTDAVNITEDIKDVAVTFNRVFTPNSGYATIMLPFDVNATKLTGVRSVIEFDGVKPDKNGNNAVGMRYVWCDATLGEQELEKGHPDCNKYSGELKAYTPYMVDMKSATLGINGNVTLKSNSGKIVGDAPEGNWVFRGTLQKKVWPKGTGIINEGRLWAFAAAERSGAKIGEFVQFGGNNWANPFRAYLVECKKTDNGLDCSDEDSENQPKPSLVSRYRFADALAPTNSAEKSAGAAATDQPLVLKQAAASETASLNSMDIVIVYGDKDSESDKERPTVIGRFNPATGEIRMLPRTKRTYDLKGRRVGNGKKAKGAYYRK